LGLQTAHEQYAVGVMSDRTTDWVEARAGRRRTVLLGGLLVHGSALLTTECTVRDLSEGGARVQVSTFTIITAPVALLVVRLDRAWAARVVWQAGLLTGLRFERAIELKPDDTSEPDRTVRRLWVARRF
jgi:hypothetical protein